MSASILPGERLPLSTHAVVRCQQRGVSHEVLDLLFERFDVERNVGRGCHAISCSREALALARRSGVAAALIERLAGVVVIIAPDGAVVTVMNRETWFARFQRGQSRMSARERAKKAARHRRGGGL